MGLAEGMSAAQSLGQSRRVPLSVHPPEARTQPPHLTPSGSDPHGVFFLTSDSSPPRFVLNPFLPLLSESETRKPPDFLWR